MAVRTLPFLLIASVAATPAAADTGPLQIASEIFVAQRSLDNMGAVREKLVPATRAVPGDHVVFVLSYRNRGTQPLHDIILDNPVPAAIAYTSAEPQTAEPELSVDGKSFGKLAQLRVATADGAMRNATPADVKHVRWRIPAAPAGASGRFAFKAVLK